MRPVLHSSHPWPCTTTVIPLTKTVISRLSRLNQQHSLAITTTILMSISHHHQMVILWRHTSHQRIHQVQRTRWSQLHRHSLRHQHLQDLRRPDLHRTEMATPILELMKRIHQSRQIMEIPDILLQELAPLSKRRHIIQARVVTFMVLLNHLFILDHPHRVASTGTILLEVQVALQPEHITVLQEVTILTRAAGPSTSRQYKGHRTVHQGQIHIKMEC